MSKRILLLTFYYPPDLSAGSFRASALVDALQRKFGADIHIEVLTTLPNRYSEHAIRADRAEAFPGLVIRRVKLPARREGFVGQAHCFVRFARKVLQITKKREYDVVIATSSRLMTALLGANVAARCGSRLYLDIRDIFVENLGVLFKPSIAQLLISFFGFFERRAVMRADKVNLVSLGFLPYFQQRYPGKEFSFFSNGVDDAFANDRNNPSEVAAVDLQAPVQILYAGNVGDGQGLHMILPQLAKHLDGRVHFRVVGAGGRLGDLIDAIRAQNVENIEIMSPIPRSELLGLYRAADVLFLHLNDKPAFEQVLPSKLFEYAAMGKPIWAGVAGYAAEFVFAEVENSVVFPPCDVQAAVDSFELLVLKHTDRSRFVQHYARRKIMDAMAQDIVDLLESDKCE